jgi:hypothetical protein
VDVWFYSLFSLDSRLGGGRDGQRHAPAGLSPGNRSGVLYEGVWVLLGAGMDKCLILRRSLCFSLVQYV